MTSDFIDPATENWRAMDDTDVWHAAKAGVPQAIQELARREKRTDLTAVPARTIDLTTAAGPHRYRHGWIRIDASAPSAIERASRAVVTDGHTLLHGRGMVAAAHKVVERIKATGHGARVRRINVAGKPHLHVARTTR